MGGVVVGLSIYLYVHVQGSRDAYVYQHIQSLHVHVERWLGPQRLAASVFRTNARGSGARAKVAALNPERVEESSDEAPFKSSPGLQVLSRVSPARCGSEDQSQDDLRACSAS